MSKTHPTADTQQTPPSRSRKLPHIDKATAHKLVSLFAVVLGVTVVMLVINELVGGTEKMHDAVHHAGVWAPLAYLGIKALTYIIAPLSGASIEMASGALFGIWAGVGLSILGSTIGGSANYWIARTLGRKGVARFAGKKAIAQVDSTTERLGGWRALLLARIVLAPIYDFVSYAAGLVRIPFGQYVAITAIAGIPVTIVFPLLGRVSTASKTMTYAIIGVTGALFIVFGIVYLVYRRKSHSDESGVR